NPAASKITQKPARTSSWSSATRTRNGAGAGSVMGRILPSSHAEPDRDGESACLAGPDGQRAAAGGNALGDARQPVPVGARAVRQARGARQGRTQARAGIEDPDGQVLLLIGDLHPDGGTGGVAHAVGQR